MFHFPKDEVHSLLKLYPLSLSETHSQLASVDNDASIFSTGGYCAYNLISFDSEALQPFFSSCYTNNIFMVTTVDLCSSDRCLILLNAAL